MTVSKKGIRKARPVDGNKYRDNPRAVAEYLNNALTSDDAVVILKAIGDIVRAQGVAGFTQKAGMRRDTFYRSFNGGVKSPFEKVLKVLVALDMRLVTIPRIDVKLKAKK